ncbi:MAG: orotate phosphoribosyltransferase-like protein [Methanomicrobiales archaeon]|nr:orotate phosphoribosyltransferase-like protein [Methanomicrobiales archaeon]
MSTVDDLIRKAKQLLSEGHSQSQIGDELNLSMETVTWLLTQNRSETVPKDVHIDWTGVSSHGSLLNELAILIIQRYYTALDEAAETPGETCADVIVGIALSGIPLATLIAMQEDVKVALYYPSKYATGDRPTGSISGNFASIKGQQCLIVDDVITSGKTLKEVVSYLHSNGARPLAILVIFDKRGLREVDGVPVYPLFTVTRLD